MARRKSQEEVEKIYEERGYKLLSKYINNRTPNKMQCPHGHISDTMTLWSFQKGYGCPICSHKAKLTYGQVKEYFASYGYELVSTSYIGAHDKLLIKCPQGHQFEMSYAKFYTGRRCPHCNMSSGEQEVARILEKYNVEYEIQYRFDDCKNILTLPFDFKLKNTTRPICIEFDGDMHYKLRGTDTLEYFIQRKINDGIKNEYCINKGIKLIRIPYWNFQNIEDILIKELNLNKYE